MDIFTQLEKDQSEIIEKIEKINQRIIDANTKLDEILKYFGIEYAVFKSQDAKTITDDDVMLSIDSNTYAEVVKVYKCIARVHYICETFGLGRLIAEKKSDHVIYLLYLELMNTLHSAQSDALTSISQLIGKVEVDSGKTSISEELQNNNAYVVQQHAKHISIFLKINNMLNIVINNMNQTID